MAQQFETRSDDVVENEPSPLFLLMNEKIYYKNICKNLRLGETNQLRKALKQKILKCAYPVSDKDDLISQIPWVSSRMVKLFKLITRKGTLSLLQRVFDENDHHLLRSLLEAGLDPNYNFFYYSLTLSLLVLAANNGDEGLKLAKILLEFKANPDLATSSFGTALIYGANAGSIKIVKLLLDAGANINYINKDGEGQALDYAIMEGHKKIVDELIRRGANIISLGSSPGLSLINSAQYGWIDLIEYFLEKGLDVNSNASDYTALTMAIWYEQIPVIKLLLKQGADPTHIDEDNDTILDIAKRTNNPEIIQLITDAISDWIQKISNNQK